MPLAACLLAHCLSYKIFKGSVESIFNIILYLCGCRCLKTPIAVSMYEILCFTSHNIVVSTDYVYYLFVGGHDINVIESMYFMIILCVHRIKSRLSQ